MKTFDNQNILPTVPMPTLQDTCETFLEWCSPLLTEEERVETQKAIETFQSAGGSGERLHNALVEYSQQPGLNSWLDRFWDTRYLGRRTPVVPDANFAFCISDEAVAYGQLERAARITLQTICYKLELDAEILPPVEVKGTPQCMEQTRNLFSATRIPHQEKDILRAPTTVTGDELSGLKHILVFFNGHMNKMDVIGPDGTPYSLQQIIKGLENIVANNSTRLAEEECVGHLTTLPRTPWADARDEIIASDPNNQAAFNEIETALFMICLDSVAPDTLHACEANLLHGDSGNRWFDKSLQYIVYANGKAGLSCEHSGVDGMIIMNLADKMVEYDITSIADNAAVNEQGLMNISPITFELSAQAKGRISEAAQIFRTSSENIAAYTMEYLKFGSSKIKSFKISPDAFIQISFQLAQYRTQGFMAATYESVATRKYKGGRTEALRVLTREIQEFIKSFDNADIDRTAKLELLDKAARKHVSRAIQCQAGEAPEQHLWELHNIFKAQGAELDIIEEPAIFRSPGWIKMRSDVLSTSSVATNAFSLIGFGSTASDCIGIGYFAMPDQLSLHLCTHKKYEERFNSYKDNLYKAFDDMAELLGGEKV